MNAAAMIPAEPVRMRRTLPLERSKLDLLDVAESCHLHPALGHLTQADKRVLESALKHLDQLTLERGRTAVWPSVARLSLKLGLTERQVRTSLNRLEAAGLIRRTLPRGWRTAHIDLAGYIAVAGEVQAAFQTAEDERHQAPRRPRLIPMDTEAAPPPDEDADEAEESSALTEIISAYTETAIEPEDSVHRADALSREPMRGAGLTAVAGSGNLTAPKPEDPDTASSAPCSPSRASFGVSAEPERSIPAKPPLERLQVIEDASPTLRRLFLPGELRSAPLEALSETIRRDYIAAIGDRLRNPGLIWTWAVRRHGLEGAMLGWIVACDSPPPANGAPRNPQGWFTRFATSETPWNLEPNLRRLRRRAAPAAAKPDRTVSGDPSPVSAPETSSPPAPPDVANGAKPSQQSGQSDVTVGDDKKPASGAGSGRGGFDQLDMTPAGPDVEEEGGTRSSPRLARPGSPRSAPASSGDDLPAGAFRDAWTSALARHIGPGRAEAAWRAWLFEARLLAPEPDGDGSIRLIVKTGFARDHIRAQLGDACAQAARRIGYPGCEVEAG